MADKGDGKLTAGLLSGDSAPKVSAIALAAGLSRRMGEDKLLLSYQGKTLIQRAVDLLADLPVYEKILVTTSVRLEKVLLPDGVHTEINSRPEDGQSCSVRLGLRGASGDWYLFMAADQPLLETDDIGQLLDCIASNNNKIIYPVIEGNPCMPALFSDCFRDELLACTGDTGGRTVRLAHPEVCVGIEPDRPVNFRDIDSTEDYHYLEATQW